MSIQAGSDVNVALPDDRSVIDLHLFHSVAFQPGTLVTCYQFRLWQDPDTGPCVLVKPDSLILEHLKTGDRLTMTYYPQDRDRPLAVMETRIRRIFPPGASRFKGHVLVQLAPVNREPPAAMGPPARLTWPARHRSRSLDLA